MRATSDELKVTSWLQSAGGEDQLVYEGQHAVDHDRWIQKDVLQRAIFYIGAV